MNNYLNIFVCKGHEMKLKEAREYLGIVEEEDESTVLHNYRMKYVALAYSRNTAVTHKEADLYNEQLKLLNGSLRTVMANENIPENSMYLDPVVENLLGNNIGKSDVPAMEELQKLKKLCALLHQDKKSGLALRLCELSVKKCLEDAKYNKKSNLSFLRELMGDQLMRIGLIEQGLKFLLVPEDHFKNGNTLLNTRDYATAIKHFGKVLQTGDSIEETVVSCKAVIRCYFLLGSFENCIDFVENIMPEVVEPGAYDPDKVRRTTGKILAYCLWSTLKGNVNRIILKLKFPMSHHIISQDYTSLHEAFNEVKKYESGSKIPEDLLKEIEPKPIIFEPVTMEYEKRELNKYFIELFNMSSATLRIMKRTSQ